MNARFYRFVAGSLSGCKPPNSDDAYIKQTV